MIGKLEMATTTKAPKAVNYTPEQAAQMVLDYTSGVSVDTIAKAMGKTVRSVVAKLSREKVYKAKVYATKTGEAVVKKDELADKMSTVFNLTEAEADSLTKANKTALKKILGVVESLQLNVESLQLNVED